MKVAFRADASLQMGSGHVMRCLTLANALREKGAECHFLCREHPGHMLAQIKAAGHSVHPLQMAGASPIARADQGSLAHANWLGVTQEQDANECAAILSELQPYWLIVDHYALDDCWEVPMRTHCKKLMAIDDLADRSHQCDLLLDQTFGRARDDYQRWVTTKCTLLCGSSYALLRPEFAALRDYSLLRRESRQLKMLLITMGGVDKDNATGQVLTALVGSKLPSDCRITVVMGPSAPWLTEVRQQAESLLWPTEVLIGVSNMAQLMAESDLAIGAAGATSWERCCLGLPTVMLVLADNQQTIAQALCDAGAAFLTGPRALQQRRLITSKQMDLQTLSIMSALAATVTDGLGVSRVITHLTVQG